MCGIAGVSLRGGRVPDRAMLAQMLGAMSHRGPDGDGLHVMDSTALVQTRLAIIDTENGKQPFVDRQGCALIANGEIYNYLELRKQINDADLTTQSDCETILPLYAQYGQDFLDHLRGMYAIALHDPNENSLILARDPFGIKPLYYAETEDGLAFASEPSVLISAGWYQAAVHQPAVKELLQLRYTTGASTCFKGISRVLPGECLVVVDGRIVSRHRRSALPQTGPKTWSLDQAVMQIDQALRDSIDVHRRSDVPYGMFLSGGIDSCSVLAVMAHQMATPVIAFTAGFSETSAPDERDRAAHVAQSVGAQHISIDVTAADFWQTLPRIVASMDDPAADYAIVPTYFLAQRARQDVKVVLSGEGGDELFAGYGRYRSALRPLWRGGKTIRSKGPFDHVSVLNMDMRGWRDGLMGAESRCRTANWSRLQSIQAVDCEDWLPNDLLTKLDRCLMRHGIEGRTPFLDPEVARVAFDLPDQLKIKNKLGKYALRVWLEKNLKSAQPFAKKQGFTVPVGAWIQDRADRIGPLVAHQAAIKEMAAPSRVIKAFQSRNKYMGFAAWTLLFYALWHQVHILGTSPDGSVEDVLSA